MSSFVMTPVEESFKNPPWWVGLSWVDKYVDDVNCGEKVCVSNAVSLFSQKKEERQCRNRVIEAGERSLLDTRNIYLYHMLSAEMTLYLQRMQRMIFKVIYGFKVPYMVSRFLILK